MNEISEKAVEVAAKAMANGAWDILDEHVQARYLVMARAALTAALPHLMGWQPIETAPRFSEVLVFDEGLGVVVSKRSRGGRGFFAYNGNGHLVQIAPTHWMPRPPDPVDQERGNAR